MSRTFFSNPWADAEHLKVIHTRNYSDTASKMLPPDGLKSSSRCFGERCDLDPGRCTPKPWQHQLHTDEVLGR